MTAPSDEGGVLTVVDVLQIQPFVFASNRLRDIVGGSALVEEASSKPTLEELAKRHGGKVVFAAGGNALLEFPDVAGSGGSDRARRFASGYSRYLIEEFPGLRVAIHHEKYEPGRWADAFVQAGRRLQTRKLELPDGAPVLGLSVTAECAETRAVATNLFRRRDGRVVPVSASVAARRQRGHDSARWRAFLPSEFAGSWKGFRLEFPLELDLLGRQSGEMSLIGIVHVDGNQVGQGVLQWVKGQSDAGSQALRAGLQDLSEQLKAVVEGAMRNVLARVCGSLELETDPSAGHPIPVVRSRLPDRRFALAKPDETARKPSAGGGGPMRYLPVRPVLLGGDDLTFVCDGRIALDLARVALETFRDTPVPSLGGRIGASTRHLLALTEADTPVPSLGGRIGASAGVAIVKSHAPFARASQLASDLCDSAKRQLRANAAAGPLYGLDWHVGFTMPTEPIDSLRRRQYRAGDWDLTHRPYKLGDPKSGYTFAWLDETVLGANGDGPKGGFHNSFWSDRRGKVRRLGEIVREGPDAVEAALETWKVTAGVEALPDDLQAVGGFDGTRTPLLDAVELLDIHLPLGKG